MKDGDQFCDPADAPIMQKARQTKKMVWAWRWCQTRLTLPGIKPHYTSNS